MAKATPVKTMIEKKKQYVPMPTIDRSARRNNNPTFAVSAPITQITQQVAFPCWPIPLCNTLTSAQVTDFCAAVVQCYEDHIAQNGTDPEFLAELLVALSESSVVDGVLNIINNELLNSPSTKLSNLCAYINDCIDTWLLVVSADADNLIIAGTDGWAYLDINSIKKVPFNVNLVANTEFTLSHNYDIEFPQVIVYWPDNKVTDVEVKYIDANTVKLLSTETINANVRISF